MIGRTLLFLLVIAAAVVAVSPKTLAYDFFTGPCNNGGSGSSVCTTSSEDPISGTNGVLRKVANIVASVAGAVAVVIIVVAGFQYVTSGGDPGKAKNARNAVIYTIVGLAVIVLSDAILGFVLSKL